MSILSRLSLVFNSSIFALSDEELLQEHAVLDLDSHLETLLVCVLAQHILFLLDFFFGSGSVPSTLTSFSCNSLRVRCISDSRTEHCLDLDRQN